MSDEGVTFIMGFIIGIVLTVLICISAFESKHKNFLKEAIKEGHAEYNSSTGKWQWKTLKLNEIEAN